LLVIMFRRVRNILTRIKRLRPPSRNLVEAYRQARYRVQTALPFELRVGEPSAAADAWLAQGGAASAVLITAYNPRSEPQPQARNAAAQERLRSELRAAGYRWLEGEGSGENWPPEPCLFVLGLSRSEAAAWARRYGQHAFLYCAPGRAVELVLMENTSA
jgi:hypothetical protein